MKKVAVYKTDLQQALSELTIAMAKVNRFVNLRTAPHKNPDMIYIIIG